jgi:hypothetical protein
VTERVAELTLELVGGQIAACGARRARRRRRVPPPAAARDGSCGEEKQRGRAERAEVLQETVTYQCFLCVFVATIS